MGVFPMSLINKMLQDLDARRSDLTNAGEYGTQIRAVPVRHRTHPAWWVALFLGATLAGVIAWMLLRPASGPITPQPKADISLAQNPPQLPATPQQSQVMSPVPAQPLPDVQQLAAAVPAVETRPTSEEKAAPAPAVPSAEKPAAMPPAPPAVKPKVAATASEPAAPLALNKQFKELGPQQRAENDYRKAASLIQQGSTSEAIAVLEQALQLDPLHAAARQSLVGLLVESKRQDDALRATREGLNLDPSQAGLAMIQARLQLEKSELRPAIDTLQHSLPHAAERADYQAFLAALLQRDARHKEAVEHYLRALQRAPQNGVWWMGLGISLQADNRVAEAQEAFSRAKASNSLTPELLAFVESKLKQLQR
jgi:MSHA biogenesis protein MshN